MRLTTGGGEIEVTECDLDGTVSTGGGHVSFAHVTGDLVGSSGSMRRRVYAESRQ